MKSRFNDDRSFLILLAFCVLIFIGLLFLFKLSPKKAACDYHFTPKPDITAYELSRITLGMNDPRVNPDGAEVLSLSRHFVGTPCGLAFPWTAPRKQLERTP